MKITKADVQTINLLIDFKIAEHRKFIEENKMSNSILNEFRMAVEGLERTKAHVAEDYKEMLEGGAE
ncbi:MAG: hypothetical protein KBT28_10810 [Bacteroidales bacterium]|nr:hypothetical protein [Candidatus Colimorpha merdihippi]